MKSTSADLRRDMTTWWMIVSVMGTRLTNPILLFSHPRPAHTSLTVHPRWTCCAYAAVGIRFRKVHAGGVMLTLVARTGIDIFIWLQANTTEVFINAWTRVMACGQGPLCIYKDFSTSAEFRAWIKNHIRLQLWIVIIRPASSCNGV